MDSSHAADNSSGPFSTSVGSKILMAITGGLLVLFIVAHLLGNLQIFAGPNVYNGYAEFLRSLGGTLWIARAVMVLVVVVHVSTAIKLSRQSRLARPVGYVCEATVQATFASRTMLFTGIALFAFISMHLLHFTFGVLQPEYYNVLDSENRHDVYTMVIKGFQDPAYSFAYIAFIIMLGVHLSHGLSSGLQTLGLTAAGGDKDCRKYVEVAGSIVAWLIAVSYISIPLAVLLGIIR